MKTVATQGALCDTVVEGLSRSLQVPNLTRDIRVMIAWEKSEWEQAFALVGESYQAAGYEAADAKPLRFTPYHALPDTVTFVAKHEERVLLTFSLVPDNRALGLPMESLYGSEIAALRREGRNLGEVISFAAGNLGLREFPLVFRSIIRLIMQYHVSQGGDTWVITVNPKHRQFYTKVLGFVPLGPCRSYERVQGAPAEALLMDLDLMRANAPRTYQEMMGDPLPPAALVAPRMTPVLARSFAQLSSQTNVASIDKVLHKLDRNASPRRWTGSGQRSSVSEVGSAMGLREAAPMLQRV